MADIDTQILLTAYRAAREATKPEDDETLFVWVMAVAYKVFADRVDLTPKNLQDATDILQNILLPLARKGVLG